MIRVAAIDTSTWRGGVALVQGEGDAGQVVAESLLQVRESHSRHLLPLLEHLLEQAGWHRSDIDLYASTRGPGSFTGLRVGLGTVRGLALAADRPCYGIGTLEALAVANGEEDRDRLPVMDAGRGEIYAARFTGRSFPPKEIRRPWLGRPETVGSDPAVLIGAGAVAHRGTLMAVSPGSLVREPPQGVAGAAGRLALRRSQDGDLPGSGMSPLYLRQPDAVVKSR
jgi:tRNA threonylcarbamoyladenosine biosynthesis protein TsaB